VSACQKKVNSLSISTLNNNWNVGSIDCKPTLFWCHLHD